MFTDVVAFGDSFSDNGNALAMFGIPKPPYFQGRFSNGPVWVEHLADRLGAKLHDLAVEGGVISDADIPKDALPASDLAMQLKNYTQKVLDPATTLYTVFCGGNDFIDNMPVALKTGVLPNVTMISGDMVAFLSDLVKANATNILLMNLPPIEASPLVIQSIGPFAPIVAKLPVQYNQQVAAGVQAIAAANAGLKLQTFDFYALVKNLIADTALFPIVNRSCLVNTTACSDPDSYLFWDHLHPTAKAHSLLANATYDFLMTGVEPTVSSTVPATTAAVVVTAAVATTSKAVTTTTAKSSASRAGLWSGRVVGVAVVSVLLQLLL
ncbi:hypothetical protein HK101_005666 [Irineochytrium annulatum]|nr:hypothetical protein HK101_005666 [Irineochytrium annulatum]